MNMVEWLHRAASLHPTKPAILSGSKVLATYAEFRARTCQLAAGLRDRYTVHPGDRVGLFLSNHPSYLEILYAVWQLGAVVVPINYKLHAREAGYILENSGAKLVFVGGPEAFLNHEDAVPSGTALVDVSSVAYQGIFDEAEGVLRAVPRSQDDLAWLFYTSGTTGRPKGVMMSHGNIQTMALSYFADVDDVRQEDTILYAAPMSHGAGIYNFMHVLKASTHCVPESGGFDPAEILALSRELGSVHMFAAPTMVKRLVEEAKQKGSDGEGIRTIVYGGGPMYVADILEATEVMGARFVQIYGQGECPMCITSLSRELVMDRSHDNWKARLGRSDGRSPVSTCELSVRMALSACRASRGKSPSRVRL